MHLFNAGIPQNPVPHPRLVLLDTQKKLPDSSVGQLKGVQVAPVVIGVIPQVVQQCPAIRETAGVQWGAGHPLELQVILEGDWPAVGVRFHAYGDH